MVSVAALTSGKDTPSTRFRIRQHIRSLANAGIFTKEYYPWLDKNAGIPSIISDNIPSSCEDLILPLWRILKISARLPGIAGSWKHDITWLGRELLPGRFTLENILHKPIVFDVDDAIWQAKPDGISTVARIAQLSNTIIAGNTYLADWLSQFNSNIAIVPTAIDTERFYPEPNKSFDEDRPFIIGWTGSSGNFTYLYNIEEGLIKFLKKYNAKLLIIAERPPKFNKIGKEYIEFVYWSENNETKYVQKMDVGLMPLPSTPWTRGKCSFKMLQYMACGIPVIVSPVGMNSEILDMDEVGYASTSSDEYYSSLCELHNNREQCHLFGKKGRALVEKNFSSTYVSRLLINIFNNIL